MNVLFSSVGESVLPDIFPVYHVVPDHIPAVYEC